MLSCPLCASRLERPAFPYEITWRSESFRYRRCPACRTVAIDPTPTDEQLGSMFEWSAYQLPNMGPYDPTNYAHLITLLRQWFPEATTIIDFACGHGHFLRCLREAGYKAVGVEYDAEAIKRAAEASGCEVATLDEALALGPFDVASALNALVALPNPSAVVDRLRAAAGGLLIDQAVEENPRLVRPLEAVAGRLRRGVPEGTPTLLWRCSASGLDAFLGRHGFQRASSSVWESGWPYAASPNRARRVLGAAARETAKVVPGWGDRFVGAYR